MLVQPTTEVLQAVATLRGSPHWRLVEEWLRRELEKSHQVLRESADDRLLRQTQGKAQFLSEFLALKPRA